MLHLTLREQVDSAKAALSHVKRLAKNMKKEEKYQEQKNIENIISICDKTLKELN